LPLTASRRKERCYFRCASASRWHLARCWSASLAFVSVSRPLGVLLSAATGPTVTLTCVFPRFEHSKRDATAPARPVAVPRGFERYSHVSIRVRAATVGGAARV